MIYIPFVFFTIIFLIIYKKRGIDASAYVTMLYIITSFAAILMDALNLIDPKLSNPSFPATIVYCLLLGLIILPVYRFNSKSIRNIKVTHIKAIDLLVYIYFAAFLFTLIAYWPDIIFKLTYGDWAELRLLLARGDSLSIVHFSGIMRIVSVFFGFVGSASFILFPIFFVSLIYLKKPWWYCLMALLSTTNVILNGIIGIDRSSTFKWLLFLGLNLVIFFPRISFKIRRRIIPVIGLIVILAVGYLASVSSSRFDDSHEGTKGSIISYAGQPYLNFCYLFDNFNNQEGFSTKYLLPATHYWILKDYKGNVYRQQELTARTGIECGAFYSVLGSFVLDANQIGPFFFVLIYLLLFEQCLKKRSRGGIISLWGLLQNYLMLLIPTFGIIAYMYVGYYTNLFLLLLFISHFLLSSKQRLTYN